MNFFRWIISAPISIVILCVLYPIIKWFLGLIFKVFYFIMCWGTRFDTPPIFDYAIQIEDFKTFIFETCLSTLISAGIAGYIGGKICPKNHNIVTSYLFGIFILPLLIFSTITFWDSEHWFYSSVWVIDMLVLGVIFVGIATGSNSNQES